MPTVRVDAIRVANRSRKDLGDTDALATSIEQVGLLHPPVVTADMRLVAGERRLEAVKILGWTEVAVNVAENLQEATALLQAERDENTCRKDLSPSETVALGKRLEEVFRPAAEERQGTRTDLMEPDIVESFHKVEAPKTRDKVADAVGGMSGRTYEKAKAVVQAAEEDPEKFAPLVKQMDATGKANGAFNALKKARQEETDAALAAEVEADLDRFTVIHSPIADLASHVDAATLDAIITDPPYPEEYLPCYSDLSAFAAHALKPGGVLLAMVGQAHLPEVITRLSEHLRYHWTLAYIMPGASAKMWGLQVIVGWKPVLMFVNGESWAPANGLMPSDVAYSTKPDKEHHDWGQSTSGMEALVEKVTQPGAIVCDPFCGGGATGEATVRMKRYFIGADREEAAVNRTKVRLAEVV